MSHPQQPDGEDRGTPEPMPYGAQQARAGQEAGMAARYREEDVDRSNEKNKLGTWALILGIVCLVALMLPVILSLTLGAATCVGAVVLGVKGVRAAGAGLATTRAQAFAGLVLGIVGVLLYILAYVGLIAVEMGAGA